MVLGRQPNIFSPIAGKLGLLCEWKDLLVPNYDSVSHKNNCDTDFEGFGKLESGALTARWMLRGFGRSILSGMQLHETFQI